MNDPFELKKKTIEQRDALYKAATDHLSLQAEGEVGAQGLIFAWGDYGTGTFQNLGNIRLIWHPHNIMEYIPDDNAPFTFTDTSGHTTTPGRFFTDGGSVPSFATGVSGITRWLYGPAFLAHDWEYSLKHCDRLPEHRTRDRVDRSMMEAIKTLMADNIVEESRGDFWAIQKALAVFSGLYWNADTDCSLDPAV